MGGTGKAGTGRGVKGREGNGMGKYTQFRWLKSCGTRLTPTVLFFFPFLFLFVALRLKPIASFFMAPNVCNMCGNDEEELRHMRCSVCHSASGRIRLLLKRGSDDFAEAWNGFSHDSSIDMAAFYAKAKGVFGEDLNKLMKETLEENVSHSIETILQGTGTFMDEEDMTEKYKNKPVRLLAILDKAKRMQCPTTGTEFIEDMEYKITVKDMVRREQHSSNKAGTEMVIKKKKIKNNAGGAAPQANPKTLTEGQKESLNKNIGAAAKQLALLQAIKDEIDAEGSKSWSGLLPTYVVTSIDAFFAKIEDQVRTSGSYIQGTEGDMKLVMASWSALLGDVKECIRRAKVQIVEAKKMQGK